MTDLYRFHGGAPSILPAAIIDPETGFEFRAPFAAEDLAGLGYTLAPSPPAFDPQTERVEWDDTSGAWVVSDLPPPPPPPAPDMPALRANALATAIAYGNRLTQGEVSQWAGVEPYSWPQQREEARIVLAGGSLDESAVLPGLAEDKGVPLLAYAQDVWANAERYQAVLRGAVYLRRTATNTLTDEAIDTPEKLADAVAALTVEADALAAQLLGG